MEIDVDALGALAQKAAIDPSVLQIEGLTPVLIGPGELKITPLGEFLTKPVRCKTSVGVIEVADFGRYVNAYVQPGYTALFGSLSKGTIRAVIDYHKADSGVSPDLQWSDHTCVLNLAPDPDWLTWIGLNGKWLSQDEFAALLDSQQWNIIEPDAATIRDIVLRFQATSIVKFERPVYDEASGSVKVSFTNESEQKGTAKLPGSVFLDLAPFRTAPLQRVEAKLRWRFRDGGVTFGFEILRPDRIAEQAFREVVSTVETATGLAVYLDS